MSSEDDGLGDEERFPAEDLEQLYRRGGLDATMRIRGSVLNSVLGVKTYEEDAWYHVTQSGVRKL